MRPRWAFAIVLLLAAMPVRASVSSFRAIPEAPTNLTPITIEMTGISTGGVPPYNARLHRVGNRIEVRFTQERAPISAVWGWQTQFSLGVLEAGDYEVVMQLPLDPHEYRIPLRVRDVTSLPILTPVVRTNDPRVWLEWRSDDRDFFSAKAWIGDREVVLEEGARGCVHHVVLDAGGIPPGLHDVRIEIRELPALIARNAVEITEPSDDPPLAGHERFLIPVFFNAFGAHGQWTSRLTLRDVDEVRSFLRPRVFDEDCDSIGSGTFEHVGPRPEGVFLYVPQRIADRIRPQLTVVQTRGNVQSSAAVPIVRERDFLQESAYFTGISLFPDTYATLRIHSIEPATFTVRIEGQTLDVTTRRQRTADPATAVVDLSAAFARKLGPSAYEVEVQNDTTRFWAWITITERATTRIRVIAAQ